MTAEEPAPWVGRRIGAYEVLALLGFGGMGEVYRARRIDAQFEKEVAIKLVPLVYSARAILQRLRAERQILARLDHPHIARLIDGGATDEGLPYLILDLVEGEPLDRYCEMHALPIRERLKLFRDVCSAVSYAHQQLVVHRDLKPGNVLVTADGTVKLLDFGIAKLLQPPVGPAGTAPTIDSASTLTLEFASPEQLLGRVITTASDVYSLGVMLYLVLTGHMPFKSDSRSRHELMRDICETEPLRPGAAGAASRGRHAEKPDADLDAITLRALRKEPEKRFRSVDELSEDIRRYLDGMPVMARGGQLAYRASKFLRRRKLEIAAASVIFVLLVAGIVSSIHQARLAQQQRARAERHVATVRGFAELSMFGMHDAIKDLPGSTAARELLVNTALQYLNELADEAARDRGLRQGLAMAYARVADIQGKAYNANTGKLSEAIESYSKAIALLDPIVAAEPADAVKRNALAQGYLQQSRMLLLLGESKKAVAGSQRAVAIFEGLAKANPGASSRAALADALRVHAINLTLESGDETAMSHAYRAIEILEDLHRHQPDDLDLEHQLGVAYGTAGDLVSNGDDSREAAKKSNELHLKALAVDEHLVNATDGRNATYVRSLLSDRVNLCSEHNDVGDYLAAIEFCRAAQPLLANLRTDSNNAQIQVDAGSLSWNLGSALLGARRINEAAKVFEQNVRALQNLGERNDNLQVRYLLAASEQALGTIEMRAATRANASRAQQLRHWRNAKEWYEKAVPRFEFVASRVTIDYPDRAAMDDAIAGLARSKAEVGRLEQRAVE